MNKPRLLFYGLIGFTCLCLIGGFFVWPYLFAVAVVSVILDGLFLKAMMDVKKEGQN